MVKNLLKINFIALKISDYATFMQTFDEMHIVRNAMRSHWGIKTLSLWLPMALYGRMGWPPTPLLQRKPYK